MKVFRPQSFPLLCTLTKVKTNRTHTYYPSQYRDPEHRWKLNTSNGGLNEKWPTKTQVFEHFVPSCWCCLGKVMETLGGISLVEEVCHWGRAWRVHSLPPTCSSLSALCLWLKIWIQLPASVIMPAICCHASSCSLGTVSKNKLFFTATEN